MIRHTLIAGLLLCALAAPAPGQGLETARRQFENGNYQAAIASLRTALAQDPENAQIHYWLARANYELRSIDRAIIHGEQAIQRDPQNSEYHLWLARAFGEKAERDNSLSAARKVGKLLEEAVRLNPKNLVARRDLVEFYSDAPWIAGGSSSKARQQAKVLYDLDPVEGHLAWAQYWMGEEKPDRVDEEYRQILALKPTRIDAYMMIADYYQVRRDAPRLQKTVDAAARVNASDPRLAYFRGVLRVLQGADLLEGERNLKSYLASTPQRSDFPSHASAREWLARLYEKVGNRAAAIEQYRLILRVDPQRKGVRDALRRLEDRP